MDRQLARVGDLVDSGVLLINDGYRMRNEELGTIGIPFVRGGDIQEGIVQTNVVDHLRAEFLPQLRAKLLAPHDVAFITKGTVGRVGRVRPEAPPFVVAPQVCFWRSLNPAMLDSTFLYYLLVGREFQDQLDAVKTHGSMAADYVSLSDQRGFRLTIPAIHEQRAIGSVLGALDDKIELNRRMSETLEVMTRALFQSWFVDLDRFRPTDETGLPPGWTWTTLQQITSKIGSGSTPRGGDRAYVAQGTQLIRSQNVYDANFMWDGLVCIEDVEAHRMRGVAVERGDVLLNITGASILRTCVVDPDVLPARVNQHVAIVRPRTGVPSAFIHQHLLRPETKSYLIGMDAGASRQAITKAHIESVRIPLPTESVLLEFDAVTGPLLQRVAVSVRESRALAELRDLLLPRLLSGQLRIRDAERAVEAVA